MPTEHISRADLESPRSAKEYLAWVETTIRRLGGTDEGKSAIRLRCGLAKTLVEEALPLAIFSRKHYKASRCVTIQHRVGNQNFDAEVIDRRIRKSPFKYLEVTQAHDGENEHYRMIALERDGHVNALGAVKKSGTKHTGITVDVANEARSHTCLHAEELKRIEAAICRKLTKKYPDETALIVAFDDYIAIHSDEDLDSLRNFASQSLLSKIANFRWLAFVGWGKQGFLEFDLRK